MKYLISAVMVVLLAGCTPYQPLVFWGRGGYEDHYLGDDRFQIDIHTNTLTSDGLTTEYLLYRTAEVAQSHGYKRFAIMHETKTSYSKGAHLYQATVQMSRLTPLSAAGKPWYAVQQVLDQYGPDIQKRR